MSDSIFDVFGRRSGLRRINLRDGPDPHDSPVVRPPDTTDADRSIPGRVGPYVVLGEVARGGVGSVLKARDQEIGRDVALKLLLSEHAENSDIARRFIEEAQIGAQLQHRGIVPIHELGIGPGGRPYFTMKLIKGRTLAALLEERAAPADNRQRLLGVFEQVCQTLAYAHARKVIHRDLKPTNVMVGTFGEVLVMDWGLAKVLTGSGDNAKDTAISRLSVIETIRTGSPGTQSLAGSVFGTPAYMSPEQAQARLEDVDERSDVFGLGAILSEILTGMPPYTGETTSDVIRQARKGYLDSAYERLDRSGADTVLCALARSCLAFEPRQRPRDAGEVARAVERYLVAQEAQVRQSALKAAEARVRAAQSRKVRKLTVALAAVVLLCLAAGGGTYLWLARRSAEHAAATTRAVNEAIDEARGLRAEAQGTQPPDLVLWNRALAAADRATILARQGAAPDVRAAASAFRDTVQGEKAQAEEHARRNEENRRTIKGLEELRGRRAAVAPAKPGLGIAYRNAFLHRGIDVENLEPEDAAARLKETGITVELALALDEWASWAMAYYGKKSSVWKKLLSVARLADPDPMRSRLREAIESDNTLELRRLAVEVNASNVEPATMLLLARSLYSGLDWTQAWALGDEARRRYPGDFSTHLSAGDVRSSVTAWALRPQSSPAVRTAGVACWNAGRIDLSLAYAREAVRLNPKSPEAYNALGIALSENKNTGGAQEAYEKAIALDPLHASAPNNLANILADTGELDRAIALYRQSIRLAPDRAAIPWHNLGGALEKKEEWHGAIAAWKEAARLGRTPSALNHKIGLTLWEKVGDLDGAATHFREAARLSTTWVVPRVHLGKVLYQQGRVAEALAAFAEALSVGPLFPGVYEQIVQTLADPVRVSRSDPELTQAIGEFLKVLKRIRSSLEKPPALLRRTYLLALSLLAASGDAAQALALTEEAIGSVEERDAEALAILAGVQHAAGKAGSAVLTLERASDLPDFSSKHEVQLEEYRRALRPDYVSYRSIDAALEAELLIPAGALWRYFPGREEPSSDLNWTGLDFDDGTWPEGPSGFGYGKGDNRTILDDMRNNYTTVYLRCVFELPDPSAYDELQLAVRVDDGFVAYLNGHEIGRHNVQHREAGRSRKATAHRTTDKPVDAAPVEIGREHFRAGKNVLALQGLNCNLTSSDLSILPVLRAVYAVDPAKDRQRFSVFMDRPPPNRAPHVAYLEGRIHERAGDLEAAVAAYRRSAEADRNHVAPWLRLACGLRALGRPEEAEAALRSFLEEQETIGEDLLELWLDLSLSELGRSWPETYGLLPETKDYPQEGTAGDILWAIRAFVEHRALRINAGGKEYRAKDGTVWGRDRFFLYGGTWTLDCEIEKTEDDPLHQSERTFGHYPEKGCRVYRIPIPKGFYRVRLHLAETDPRLDQIRARIFCVLLEERHVLTEYDAMARVGFRTADLREFPVAVDDGYLDIEVRRIRNNPRFSALEILPLDRAGFLELSSALVEETKRKDPHHLGCLAEALQLKGDSEYAIRALEEASHLPGFSDRDRARLREYRRAMVPDLVSFASIDAAVAGADGLAPGPVRPGDLKNERERFSAFRNTARGDATRLAYLEGRLLQRSGKQKEAIAQFEKVIGTGTLQPEPYLRIGECRRILGDAAAAEAGLRASVQTGVPVTASALCLWLDLLLTELGRSTWEALGSIPRDGVPEVVPIVPTAEYGTVVWRFTRVDPGNGWEQPGFDDSSWREGPGGFGSSMLGDVIARTEWSTPDIWTRLRFHVDRTVLLNPYVYVFHNDDAQVYLNGKEIVRLNGYDSRYSRVPFGDRSLLNEGWNTLAVHCSNRDVWGPQYLDVGIVECIGEASWTLRALEDPGIVRINCGAAAYRDARGAVWKGDRCYLIGGANRRPKNEVASRVAGTEEYELYMRHRFFHGFHRGMSFYSIPLPEGRYRVRCHFAETVLARKEPGSRVFSVLIEGNRVLDSYDPVKEAGFATRDVREFLVDVSDGWLTIEFRHVKSEPFISAIEIEKAE